MVLHRLVMFPVPLSVDCGGYICVVILDDICSETLPLKLREKERLEKIGKI